ncbi:MAG: hypothetical protein HZB43_04805 [candidate division Zixibacteria bacterium]|nr:hypothetical protein [candidate division Zixibacteria bacterium]
MKRLLLTCVVLILATASHACQPGAIAEKLRTWQKGVWISSGGVYSIWTDTHYFVVQGNELQDSLNIYCGASQIEYTDKGIARSQVVRVRKTAGQALFAKTDDIFDSTGHERPLVIDETKFKPGTCAFDKGILYDSIDSLGTDFILMSTCGEDRIRLHSNGTSFYLRASGGEVVSVRVEGW